MTVQVHLSQRLADLAGFRDLPLDLPPGGMVREALARLRERIDTGTGAALLVNGQLHPSVLVFVNGGSSARVLESPLGEGDVIDLLLPVAGG